MGNVVITIPLGKIFKIVKWLLPRLVIALCVTNILYFYVTHGQNLLPPLWAFAVGIGSLFSSFFIYITEKE